MNDLIIIIALILLNGVFSMSEVALISARKPRLRRRVSSNNERACTKPKGCSGRRNRLGLLLRPVRQTNSARRFRRTNRNSRQIRLTCNFARARRIRRRGRRIKSAKAVSQQRSTVALLFRQRGICQNNGQRKDTTSLSAVLLPSKMQTRRKC